ncbi:MAG TPA: phosphoenolpyruvate kinase [Thermoanaerobaculia bacterium]
MKTTLSAEALSPILESLRKANAVLAARYPGESSRRQPVHTVYGGAQVFQADTAPRLGALALRALEEYASGPAAFAAAAGIPEALASRVHARVLEKLRREPVEDFRIDFEDGYGNRPDAEEDGHAIAAADAAAAGLAAGTLPPAIGIRIKPFTEELKRRSLRTLDLFLTELLDRAGRLPDDFVVTLPKVTVPEQVWALADVFDRFERRRKLAPGTLRLELMFETPQAIFGERGEIAVLRLVEAGRGRCAAAHFGTYDYTASLQITAAHQHMAHPACDFAKHAIQVALAGTGVWLSDGATNVLPVPIHRVAKGEKGTEAQRRENREAVHAAWRLHFGHVRRSLENAYYQGWDLHPAQLPTRYAAVFSFFLEGLDAASARLRNFVEKAGQATLVGEVFDDAATGQGLLNYFLRALQCGAMTEAEAVEKSGLTLEELRSRSFVKILKTRHGPT